ncbi:hypothetical protein ACFOD1_02055 [Pseudidiomarina halophila]|uniref:hypothetical protein n=2 Tax=Pseudidiomarina halophila TaxID=1449799 RepID=UPI000F86F935|nr:hypothetical protein [Pseudidiomarina halophila]
MNYSRSQLFNTGCLLLSLITFPSFALQVDAVQPSSDHLIVCDSGIDATRCQSFTDQQLVESVRVRYGDAELGSCSLNCSEPSPAIPSLRVPILILDIDNEQAYRKEVIRVEISGQSTYSVWDKPVLDSDLALLTKTVDAVEAFDVLSMKLSFVQDTSSSEFKNSWGEMPSELGMSYGTVSDAVLNRLGNCQTAYSWYDQRLADETLPFCSAFVTRQLDRMFAEARASRNWLDHLVEVVRDWQMAVNPLFISISVPQADHLVQRFQFADGSLLVIEIEPSDEGSPAIAVNKTKSRTSTGESFENFSARLADLGSGSQLNLSSGEAFGLFGTFDCRHQLLNAGVFQRFRVEILAVDSEGKPTRVNFVLLSQESLVEEQFVCEAF